jgi:hypothetical protein
MKSKLLLIPVFLVVLSVVPKIAFSQVQNTVDKKAELYNRIFYADSLLTDEEIKLKYISGDLIISNMYFDGKTICTKLTEDDFIKNNIPTYYYKVLLQDLKAVNEYNLKNNIDKETISEKLLEAKEYYLKTKPTNTIRGNQSDSTKQQIQRLSLPDTLLTKEEKAIKTKISDILVLNLKVIDDKLEITVTEELFKANNIPFFYLTEIQKNLNDINDYFQNLKKSKQMSKEEANTLLQNIVKEFIQYYKKR